MTLFRFLPESQEIRLLKDISLRLSAIERTLQIDTSALANLITMERKTMLDISTLKSEVASLSDLDSSIAKLAAGYKQSITDLTAQLAIAQQNAASGNSGVTQAELDGIAAQIKTHEEALSALVTVAAGTPASAAVTAAVDAAAPAPVADAAAAGTTAG